MSVSGVQGQLPPTTAIAPAQAAAERSPPQGQIQPPPQGQPGPQTRGSPQKQQHNYQKTSPNKYPKSHQKPHQAYHQPQGVPNRLPGQPPAMPANQNPKKRNPVMELKNWCHSMGLREPKYDFFGQVIIYTPFVSELYVI